MRAATGAWLSGGRRMITGISSRVPGRPLRAPGTARSNRHPEMECLREKGEVPQGLVKPACILVWGAGG